MTRVEISARNKQDDDRPKSKEVNDEVRFGFARSERFAVRVSSSASFSWGKVRGVYGGALLDPIPDSFCRCQR